MEKYPYFKDTPYILDNVQTVIEQRPVQDADFTDGEVYDGVLWNDDDDASTKQKTKIKYVARRKVMTVSMFKMASGVNFFYKMIADHQTTQKLQPPKAALPSDSETVFEPEQGFKADWFLVSQSAQYIKDSNIEIHAQFKKTFKWELVLVNSS